MNPDPRIPARGPGDLGSMVLYQSRRMKRRLSALEILLIVVSSLLLIGCVGLFVVARLSLKPEGKLTVRSRTADICSRSEADEVIVCSPRPR